MKVIVAGSRSIIDYEFVKKHLDDCQLSIKEVVSGGAIGVDRLGERWAKENNIPIKQFLPDWKQYGKQAGFLRNHDMALYADFLVAFWDGKSRGTQDMFLKMSSLCKPHVILSYEEEKPMEPETSVD